MRLRDILDNQDLIKQFDVVSDEPFGAYYDDATLAPLLGYASIDYDHYRRVNNSGRFKSHAIRTWVCTDTPVGLYLITLDGIVVLIKYQQTRKSRPEWFFVNEGTFRRVKSVFESYDEPTPFPIVPLNYMFIECGTQTSNTPMESQDLGFSSLEFTERLERLIRERYEQGVRSEDQALFGETIRRLDYIKEKHEEFLESLPKELKTTEEKRCRVEYNRLVVCLEWLKSIRNY